MSLVSIAAGLLFNTIELNADRRKASRIRNDLAGDRNSMDLQETVLVDRRFHVMPMMYC